MKFVMVRAWWRVEEGADQAVKNIPETLASIGFGVEVNKLYFCIISILSKFWPWLVTHGLDFLCHFHPVISANDYFMTQTHENHQYIQTGENHQ